MIKSIGQSASAAIEAAKLREGGKAKSSSSVSGRAAPADDATPSPAARMAAQGAPVDLERVARIKAAIARGDYPVDPAAIADRMVELDLPVRG